MIELSRRLVVTKIQLSISIEIPRRDSPGPQRISVGLGSGERAVTPAENDRDCTRLAQHNGQVSLAVAIEILHRHRRGLRRQREILRRLQGAVAVAEQN